MAVSVSFVEWVSAETPGTTPHDNFTFKTAGDPTPTITAATNLNFGSTSARDLTPASYPITAGNLSYDKYFKAQFSGSFTKISNGKLWKSDGDYVTGEAMQFSGAVDFATPAAADAGDGSIATSAPGDNNVVLRFGGTTESALPEAGESESSADYFSGSRTDVMRFQLLTTGASPTGAVNQKTVSFSYDVQ